MKKIGLLFVVSLVAGAVAHGGINTSFNKKVSAVAQNAAVKTVELSGPYAKIYQGYIGAAREYVKNLDVSLNSIAALCQTSFAENQANLNSCSANIKDAKAQLKVMVETKSLNAFARAYTVYNISLNKLQMLMPKADYKAQDENMEAVKLNLSQAYEGFWVLYNSKIKEIVFSDSITDKAVKKELANWYYDNEKTCCKLAEEDYTLPVRQYLFKTSRAYDKTAQAIFRTYKEYRAAANGQLD
ncbi:hypothetical protein AAIR98_001073 [Elusimicrobium simillimum]|uniref:hypothetical protein n=1 Tax=Elusimicrobium simillimum TaxID=3143438 RepID=UPI003C6F7C87